MKENKVKQGNVKKKPLLKSKHILEETERLEKKEKNVSADEQSKNAGSEDVEEKSPEVKK